MTGSANSAPWLPVESSNETISHARSRGNVGQSLVCVHVGVSSDTVAAHMLRLFPERPVNFSLRLSDTVHKPQLFQCWCEVDTDSKEEEKKIIEAEEQVSLSLILQGCFL